MASAWRWSMPLFDAPSNRKHDRTSSVVGALGVHGSVHGSKGAVRSQFAPKKVIDAQPATLQPTHFGTKVPFHIWSFRAQLTAANRFSAAPNGVARIVSLYHVCPVLSFCDSTVLEGNGALYTTPFHAVYLPRTSQSHALIDGRSFAQGVVLLSLLYCRTGSWYKCERGRRIIVILIVIIELARRNECSAGKRIGIIIIIIHFHVAARTYTPRLRPQPRSSHHPLSSTTPAPVRQPGGLMGVFPTVST
ncbi:hypothetical protein FHL15_000247 [Xylaria flabelliformis]|uniref:Uncharacterized protein n=1 Tax=Xylaria flabelliformis TaxID=2512241 RepID=A0A553IFC7_9PEZI|nr:hypothetical protein FHL15_000247 [Xylaria flabelliformis]